MGEEVSAMAATSQAGLLLQKQLKAYEESRGLVSPPDWSMTTIQTALQTFILPKKCGIQMGEDPEGEELASERWNPVHTVETIVLGLISMLSSPNEELSPANVLAAKEWKERRDEFKKNVSLIVRKSQEML